MKIDPRTPVVIGAGVASRREQDPAKALEPVALMAEALESAADDAGSRDWLARADTILVPRGFWPYRDPGRWLAQRFGAADAHTVLTEIGILQTTLFGRAARDIAEGRAEVVLVAGGEAKHRSLRAQIAGVDAPITEQPDGTEPDETLRPHADLASAMEMAHGLQMPVGQYALMDDALRHAEGQSRAAHRDELAALQASFSEVAAANPHAWTRARRTPQEIRDASDANPMLALPYTKLHNSQWNVDQAAGLVMCSWSAARAAGIADERLVFPLAVAESNHLCPLTERPRLQRSAGFRHAAARAFAHAALDPARVEHVELYSCFPSAVRIQAREIGVPPTSPWTWTGGMAYAGGPLNNFVLQAAAAIVPRLRRAPGSAALLNAVSGYLSKQGVSLWSTRPPQAGFAWLDVSSETAADTRPVAVDPSFVGTARVIATTVLHARGRPMRGVLVCEADDGTRTITSSDAPEVLDALLRDDPCGRAVKISGADRHPSL